jgi:hypothetical protein
MTTQSPAVAVDVACDYLHAVLTGGPIFAATVADAYGSHLVARGMATLLVFLIADAAEAADATPVEIVQRVRETYAREAAS